MLIFNLEGRIDTTERALRKNLNNLINNSFYLDNGCFPCHAQSLVRNEYNILAFLYAMDKRFNDSLGCIYTSSMITKVFFEMYFQGKNISPGLVGSGCCDDIMLILLTKDRELIHSIGSLFVQTAFDVAPKYNALKRAYYISQPLSLLLTCNIESAKKCLLSKRTKEHAHFHAICGAMDAIVAYDKDAFDDVIRKQIRAWKFRFARQNTPERYVNHLAASLICLAEYVWEEKVKSDYDEIVNQLVCQTEYTPYPLPPDFFKIPTPSELELLKIEAEQKKKPKSFLTRFLEWLKR